MSDDYAIPPDAVSCDSTASPSLASLCRAPPTTDSPRRHDALEKSGHLAKFVLKNGTLSYWKSQSEVNRKPQGQIGLGEACKISRNEGAATFEIFTGSRTYYLTADSIATMEDWIRVLQNPTGQINMRDARVEDVEHVSDSDSEEKNDDTRNHLTVAIYPQHQGPTYLLFESKADKDSWLYHLTVVSGGGLNCVLWRHPTLLYSKENLTSPLTSLNSEALQAEALKLFKCVQLFMSVAVEQAGIDYHVVLAQNALAQCLEVGELQDELASVLARQTTPHTSTKLGVQQLLLCATQSLFTCDTGAASVGSDNKSDVPPHAAGSPSSIQECFQAPLLSVDCKSNPPTYSFVQGWQLLALAVSLFVPRNNRLLWYLKLHLSRHADSKTECGKYAAYCARALERTIRNGGREDKPSRMEVISFDGSTTVEEFLSTLSTELGCRESAASGFALFSDDPIEKDLEHHIKPDKKLCDVISKWETALREKGSGKFENSRVIRLTYRNRLYFKNSIRTETDKERELAAELGALMAQLDMGDYSAANTQHNQPLAHRFYPYRYRAGLSNDELRDVEEKLRSKWVALKGRSSADCVRIYLNCTRKWPFFGATLFQARDDLMMLIDAEDAASPVHKMLISLNKPKMAELTHLIADYKNALLRGGGPGTPQMNSLTRNGSHRSVRKATSSSLPHSSPCTLQHAAHAAHASHAAGTLTSHATTLSDRNNTLTLSSHSYSHERQLAHGQPDILKSTPDHHRADKKRAHAHDSSVA
ncbi:hypothetical protein HF086_012685 [Spodoptera exigua]|uniref:Uncharacterized protein n=1 Tax=Spodoptera exigua TaxID=7107 RepID=A0A922MFU2_SPOEX|nr:hypothetical protein HF086_012685 [Spodoptera exigua]